MGGCGARDEVGHCGWVLRLWLVVAAGSFTGIGWLLMYVAGARWRWYLVRNNLVVFVVSGLERVLLTSGEEWKVSATSAGSAIMIRAEL